VTGRIVSLGLTVGWVFGKKDFFQGGARDDDSGGGQEAWIKPCLVVGLDNGGPGGNDSWLQGRSGGASSGEDSPTWPSDSRAGRDDSAPCVDDSRPCRGNDSSDFNDDTRGR
jgi:hypothetical protein